MRTNPLKSALFVRFIWVALAPLGVIAFVIALRLLPLYESNVEQRNLAMAQAVAGQVDAFLGGPELLLRSIQAELTPGSFHASAHELLASHVLVSDMFDAIYLIGADDRVEQVGLATARLPFYRDYIGLDMGQKPFVRRARASGATTWSSPFLSVVSGGTALALAMPVGERMLVADFRIDRLDTFMRGLRLSDMALPLIIDRHGQVVASSRHEPGVLLRNINNIPLVQAGLRGGELTGGFELDGVEYIGSVVSVPGPNWAVLVAQRVDDAYRPISTAATILGFGGLGALAFAMGVALLIARRVSQPIENFARQARTVSQGRYELDFARSRFSELEALSDSFKRMVGAVQSRERQLRSSEHNFRTLVEFSASIPWRYQVAEDRIVYIGRQVARLLGGTHESWYSTQKWRQSIHPEDRASAATLLRPELWEGAEFRNAEYRVKDAAGGYIWIRNSATVVGNEGGSSELVGFMFDITAQKESERELARHRDHLEELVSKRTEELQRANQAKTEFLSKMSHELRTPLNAIIGLSEMLLEDAEAEQDQDEIESLTRVVGAAKHLLSLINDVLDLSKIEAGRLVLSTAPIEVQPLAREVVQTIKPLAAANGNRVLLDLPDEPLTVVNDITRLRQLLLNLLSNAGKFTRDGTVSLIVRTQGEDTVAFSVVDTGIGIAAEQQPFLFQEFMQVAPGGASQDGGTGLGLAICKRLCTLMGGRIEVESEPGRGSRFTAYLPTQVGELSPANDVAKDAVALQGRPFLLVDDDRAAREALAGMLVECGVPVLEADSGPLALELARKHRPAVVMLEPMTAHMDGVQTSVLLKSHPETENIPVIVVTASPHLADEYLATAAACLEKPVAREAVEEIVRLHAAAVGAEPAPRAAGAG